MLLFLNSEKKNLITLLWNHHYMNYQVCTTFKNIARGELLNSNEASSYEKKKKKKKKKRK